MIVQILIGVGVVLGLLILLVATRPAMFHIERSSTIAAPAERVFDQVNDLHAWTAWSPWEKLDPELKRTYSGPGSGVNACYAWAGNNKVGEGRMTIEQSGRPNHISIKLEFIKPFTATNTASFTFKPVAEGTRVIWAMDGTNNFFSKAFSMFVNMDRLIGADFERGLAKLKDVAQGANKA